MWELCLMAQAFEADPNLPQWSRGFNVAVALLLLTLLTFQQKKLKRSALRDNLCEPISPDASP